MSGMDSYDPTRRYGIALALSERDIEDLGAWPFQMTRVQREAERMIGQPACLSLVEAVDEGQRGWRLRFKIEAFPIGAEPRYLPGRWPPGDHQHAVTPPHTRAA